MNSQTNEPQKSLKPLDFTQLSAFLTASFIFVSHLAILPDQFRHGYMLASVVVAGLLLLFQTSHLPKGVVLNVTILAFIVLVAAIISHYLHPPLTEHAKSKRTYFIFIFFSCFLILPLHSVTKHESKALINWLIIISILYSVMAYVSPSGENIRRSGIELNPALHAKLLFFPSIFLIAQIKNQKPSLWIVIFTIFGIMASLKTGSRGPLFAFIAIFVFDQILNARARTFLVLPTAIVITISSAVLYLSYMPPEIADRFTIASVLEQREEGQRLFLFSLAWDVIVSNPLGIGMGNFSDIFWINEPHNIFLEIILDFGIVLSLPLLYILLRAVKITIRNIRGDNVGMRFVSLWFMFYILNAQIGGELAFGSMLLYLSLGILLLTNSNSRSA